MLASTLRWDPLTLLQAAPSSPVLLPHPFLSIPPTGSHNQREKSHNSPFPHCAQALSRDSADTSLSPPRGPWKLTQELQGAPQHLVPTHHLDNLTLHQQIGNQHGDQEATEAPQALSKQRAESTRAPQGTMSTRAHPLDCFWPLSSPAGHTPSPNPIRKTWRRQNTTQ